MKRKEFIKKYTNFFISKKHKKIPSAPLMPENDPTVLFTTAGMHPLVPYLLGQPHPLKTKRLVSVQKCLRTTDIEEIGDPTHHTFFEMLGNWSLGDYWKKDSINYSYEFLTKVLKIPKEKLAITCFKGSSKAQRDDESYNLWIELGIPKERILFLEDNWWGPAGETGPCGPDTEIFFWTEKNPPASFNPNDNKWIEIWNNVFMEYNKVSKNEYLPLKQKNVDTGMGLERTLSVLNKIDDNYLTDTFLPIIKKIELISGKKYSSNKKEIRIIADHLKAAVFILGDNKSIKPGNTEQGYILRRLIRRAIRFAKKIGIEDNFTSTLALEVLNIYNDYPELRKNKNFILTQLNEEENKFKSTLEKGLIQFEKISKNKKSISGKDAFLLYQSYGFPIEMTEEIAKEKNIIIDKEGFEKESQKHQKLSKTSAGIFKSGLADNSEATTKLHTATHLLNEALRKILGKEVKQKGSNINPERLRFDFNYPRKLTEEEISKIEDLVNEKIQLGLEVKREEMSYKKAIGQGAQAEFGQKYPEKVSVYTILDKSEDKGWFSKELCTGPHVKNTKEIGKFKIIKEESSSAGIRRIKATLK